MSNRTPRTERTARTTMYDEELDETMLPPQVTRITDKRSNHNNLSLNQTANMNRPYMQVTGLETVEYVSITRPAPMLTRNIQGRRHSGHDKQRRSQQRAGQHRSRTQHNRSDIEVGTRLLRKTLVPSHTQIVNASRKERESLESNKKEMSRLRKEAEVVYDGQAKE